MLDINVSEIVATLPSRLCDVINPWVQNTPNHPALVETSGTWTYQQLDNATHETERWLKEDLGIRPGDRVMIVIENCRAFLAILFALNAIGAWPVLVNSKLTAPEVDQIRDHCGARRILYMTAVSPQATQHAKRHGATIAPVGNLGPIGVGALNESVQPEPIDPAEPPQNHVGALIYTSGTTGLPKGVVLTNHNMLFMAGISAKIRSLSPRDRLYGILPMSHAVGLSVVTLGTLISGATLYITPRFDPVSTHATLEKERLTVVLGVPAMFHQLLEYAKFKNLAGFTTPDLRIISSSGAPLDPSVKVAVEKFFGMPLYNGYGVTETSPNIAQAHPDEPRTDTSVGRVFPGIEVKFVDQQKNPVAAGEVGELWVRGPNVMKGYYRAPEETAAAIDSEGWFNTRDLAQLRDGHLLIIGRTKELIVRFGFNVYPAEVESIFNAHPAVLRSAVIGRSVEGDEEVIAFLQLRPGVNLTPAEAADHAAKNLAPYKRPSQIFFVPELPLNLNGKVIKAELPKLIPIAKT
jgi:long-chain acyl-CoA synthetase